MYEISCFLRRISSHLPICDMSDIHCITYENVKIIAVVRPMFTATRRVSVTSKIRDREVNLRIKLHISYIDQLVVPAIFNYLIGAKNVDSIIRDVLHSVVFPCYFSVPRPYRGQGCENLFFRCLQLHFRGTLASQRQFIPCHHIAA